MIGTNPDAGNIETRSKDINTLAKVGEVGTFISNGGSTDSDSKGTGSWGVVASITVVITSGDSKDNTFLDSLKKKKRYRKMTVSYTTKIGRDRPVKQSNTYTINSVIQCS